VGNRLLDGARDFPCFVWMASLGGSEFGLERLNHGFQLRFLVVPQAVSGIISGTWDLCKLQAHSICSDQAFRKILRSRMLAEKTERFIGQNELVIEPTPPRLAKRATKFIKACRSRRNPLKHDQLTSCDKAKQAVGLHPEGPHIERSGEATPQPSMLYRGVLPRHVWSAASSQARNECE
jgi:hypothetical protein